MEYKFTVSAVIEQRMRYLALQMVKDKKWGLPAGKIEHRESDKEALKREMSEEIGSEIAILCPVGIYRFISDGGNDIINIVYAVRTKREPRIVRPREIKNLAWLTFKEWNEYAKNQQLRAPKAQMQALRDYQNLNNSADCISCRNQDIFNIVKTLF